MPRASRFHEHCRAHRQGGYVYGPNFARTAFVTDTMGCYGIAVMAVKEPAVVRVRTEPCDDTMWDRCVPHDVCNDMGAAGIGCHGSALSVLTGISGEQICWEWTQIKRGMKNDSSWLMSSRANHVTAEIYAMVLSSLCQSGGPHQRLYSMIVFLGTPWTRRIYMTSP